jgi:Ca-activated chloride channel family protein
MTFADPRWLWGIAALPLLAALEWRAAARAERALRRLLGDPARHVLLEQRRPGRRRISAALRLLALALLCAGAAGPEWGRELVRRNATGSDVVMVFDVSASMDARDVVPSRLAEARREALAVLDRLGGSRVGVVAFAGDAVRLCPLTLDLAAVRLTIEALSSYSVSDPGTDLGRGLRLARKLMPGGRREEQAMLVWTDGEDLEQGARAAIEEIAAAGTRVFAIGVGTPSGDVVPVLDDQGRATDVRRDESGSAVRSRLDAELLRTLARRTHGGYFGASRPGGELPRLLSALSGLARAGRGQRLVERPVARFPLLGGLAALLLAVDLLRARRRTGSATGARPLLHSGRGAAAAALLGLLAFSPRAADAQSAWARGDRAFRAGRFGEADSLYARRARNGGPAEVMVNRATARVLAGKAEEAQQELARYAGREGRVGDVARYNLGTVFGERKEFDPALESLRRALERSPGDEDARWNYEVIMRRKQEEERRRSGASPPPPQPPPGGGGGAAPQPAPQPSPPPNRPPAPSPRAGTPGTPPPTGGGGEMSRPQAERLLSALQELARAEQQRQRKVRVMREKRGKDW